MSASVVDLTRMDSADPANEASDGVASSQGRFQPGRSGNPKGRPRKSKQQQSAIEAALAEQVTIKDSKGTRKVSTAQAIAKRVVHQALQGDLSALKVIQRESPDFLKEVQEEDEEGGSFMRHLVETMSESAVMEFRHALGIWAQKRPKHSGPDRSERKRSQQV